MENVVDFYLQLSLDKIQRNLRKIWLALLCFLPDAYCETAFQNRMASDEVFWPSKGLFVTFLSSKQAYSD